MMGMGSVKTFKKIVNLNHFIIPSVTENLEKVQRPILPGDRKTAVWNDPDNPLRCRSGP